MCIIWRDVEKLRWKCYTRHGDGQLNDDEENVLLSMNLISIKQHRRTEIEYECIMKWKSEVLQPIAGKVLEYLVYLPFAGNLSHFSRSVLYVSVDDWCQLFWWCNFTTFMVLVLFIFFSFLSLSPYLSADVIWNSNNFL